MKFKAISYCVKVYTTIILKAVKLLLSTVVEWYELHCKQFAHTYSTLWGKENETS